MEIANVCPYAKLYKQSALFLMKVSKRREVQEVGGDDGQAFLPMFVGHGGTLFGHDSGRLRRRKENGRPTVLVCVVVPGHNKVFVGWLSCFPFLMPRYLPEVTAPRGHRPKQWANRHKASAIWTDWGLSYSACPSICLSLSL
ncbi:hypothetical protein ElyMa_005468600 [Elysia marginata]|uniref:Uncharacterized protein n=1 Tax=Elysia marginata TaxID=1093978 RepID=A0AAV4EP22_9GAST|nr:hypothetical protein ElyMa_005468600 [Elysia marginata]